MISHSDDPSVRFMGSGARLHICEWPDLGVWLAQKRTLALAGATEVRAKKKKRKRECKRLVIQ